MCPVILDNPGLNRQESRHLRQPARADSRPLGVAAASRGSVSLTQRLTEQPVIWGVPGWRYTFPARRAWQTAGARREVIPVAGLRTSVSAGVDGPVVVLSGEADTTTATLLRDMLATQLGTGARLLTVDASGLSFLDSASLRVLVLAARALQGRHGTLVFARPQPLVVRLLEITGADRLLDIQELAARARAVDRRLSTFAGGKRPGMCRPRVQSLRLMRPNARKAVEGVGNPVFRLRDGGCRNRQLLPEIQCGGPG